MSAPPKKIQEGGEGKIHVTWRFNDFDSVKRYFSPQTPPASEKSPVSPSHVGTDVEREKEEDWFDDIPQDVEDHLGAIGGSVVGGFP